MTTLNHNNPFVKCVLSFLLPWAATWALAENYLVRHLAMGEGLSCNYVVDMAQDKYGFLWLATEEGLNRFDGDRFFTYYKCDGGISSSELNCVLDDSRDPILWVGTKNDGLNSFNYLTEEWRCYRHDPKNPHSLATNDITDIQRARDGKLWVATYWEGLELFDPQTAKFTHFDKKRVKGMPDNQFWCVLDMGNGVVMGGQVKSGLTLIDTQRLAARNFQHHEDDPNSLSSNDVSCLYRDKNGTVWVGTSMGVDIFDPLNQRFLHVASSAIHGHRVYDFCELPNGKMMVATEQQGLAVLDLGSKPFAASSQMACSFIKEGNGEYNLSGNSIRCLAIDKYNNVWAGFYGSGVNFLTSLLSPFQTLGYGSAFQTDRLTEKSAMAVTFDASGQLWVGTDGGGINVFSPELQRVACYPSEAGSIVQAASCDSRGNLWLGSFLNGAIVRMAHGGIRQALPNNREDVRCFYEDGNHHMWVGTSRGIYVFDIASMRLLRTLHLGNDLVRSIVIDTRHRLWVGYYGYGIEVYSPQLKRIVGFDSAAKEGLRIPSNNVNHLMRDSRGRIWAATNEGAVCFDARDFRKTDIYGLGKGFDNIHVRAIVEDDMHNIWMSTNRGIACLRHEAPQCAISFNEKDGVVLANFNDGCVARSADGSIYFGSAQGICHFSPRSVLGQSPQPEVMLTSLSISRGMERNDSLVNLTTRDHISLAHDENTFTVNFSVRNFAQEKYVEYSYRLQGLQNEWVTVRQGNLTLRELPSGTYRLQVRARIHTQEWPAQLAEIPIAIRPPFWLTWWAKLFYAVLAVAALVTGMRIYRRHLNLEYQLKAEKDSHEKKQKLNEERLRFFTNITHELRTPLTLILGPLDDISHSSGLTTPTKHKLAVIHQSAVRLNELVKQILEFRKTETDSRHLRVAKANVVDVVHEISLKYEELAQKPNVDIRFVAPENPIEMYIDREVIAIIVDNLISNAIKYTDRGNIDVSVERRRSSERHLVDITVSDTGHGISATALPHIFDRYYQENGSHQASGTGIGLSLVKKLVQLHHGEVTAKSDLERGTSFIVTLDEQEIYPEALRGKEESAGNSTARTPDTDVTLQGEEEVEMAEAGQGGRKPLLLVVEDNKDILEYVADSFAHEFEVVKAADGCEGLALALDKMPDVIISDIMMPHMDGNAMCRALKKDVRTSHVPVILLTAKDSLADKEQGYEAGADSYITKPFTHSLLRSRIHNLLQQRQRDKMQIQESKETDLAQKKEQLRKSLNKVDQEFFDKLNKLIDDNISGDVDVNLLANHLAVSTSTLYRKMKALTGISTNEYIRKYKMQYAEHLLLEGRYSISEIAFMVGMGSVAYFRRCFKAEYGDIPSEYLKKLKEGEG